MQKFFLSILLKFKPLIWHAVDTVADEAYDQAKKYIADKQLSKTLKNKIDQDIKESTGGHNDHD